MKHEIEIDLYEVIKPRYGEHLDLFKFLVQECMTTSEVHKALVWLINNEKQDPNTLQELRNLIGNYA